MLHSSVSQIETIAIILLFDHIARPGTRCCHHQNPSGAGDWRPSSFDKCSYLCGEGVLGVAVGRVQIDGVAALELLQVWVLQEVCTEPHVAAVDVCLPTAELEQDLCSPWAVVGIYQRDLDACGKDPPEMYVTWDIQG